MTPDRKRNSVPRNRRELLASFPGLGAAGPLQHRQLDECLDALNLFDDFASGIAEDALVLDRFDQDSGNSALNNVLSAACRCRLFSLAMPRSLGGSGFSMLALSVGLEHLSQTCVGVANLVAAHGLALALVGATGNLRVLRALADRIIVGEREGRAFLLATAATEAAAGSDIENFEALGKANFESHADPVGDGHALYGRKLFVSNGSLASAHVVVMPTRRDAPRDTLAAFLVYAGTPGLSVVRTECKLGQRACPAAELLFENCRVPRDQRLNEGSIAGNTLDLVLGSSRTTLGAFGAGVAWGVWSRSRALCEGLFGGGGRTQPLHPSAQAILARMWSNAYWARSTYVTGAQLQRHLGLVSLMESETLRALDRFVPTRFTHGAWADRLLSWQGIDREAKRILASLPSADVALASVVGSAAKIQTSELALANCALAMDLLGIQATREDSGIPKYWRDARLLAIYEGTNEICALDVARIASARSE